MKNSIKPGQSNLEMRQLALFMAVFKPGLKIKRNGRIDTNWGDKSPIGLLRTIKRILEEGML